MLPWALALACWAAAPATARAARLDPCEGRPDNALCNDQNPCTTDDRCVEGRCVGKSAADGTECTDGNLCTMDDRCAAGACVGQLAPEGMACDDKDLCTIGEICHAGVCAEGVPRACDDGDVCTVDTCVATQGCVSLAIPRCEAPEAGVPTGDAALSDGPSPRDSGGADSAPGTDAPTTPDPIDASPSDAPSPETDAPPDPLPRDAQAGRDGPRADAAGARDASAEAEPDAAIMLRYRAEGGACACALGRGDYGGGSSLFCVLALVGALLVGRRRR